MCGLLITVKFIATRIKMEALKELRKELQDSVKQIELKLVDLPSEDSREYDPSEEVIMMTKVRTIETIIFIIECKMYRANKK
tara:strand:- start:136 stop:381 length:246 start_codon:yes stop_codon:yes gene_type:complete